jgi:hypothetical protein
MGIWWPPDPREYTGWSDVMPVPWAQEMGSIPIRETVPLLHGGRSSVGRAPGCGPGCRGFEPRRSPQPERVIGSNIGAVRESGLIVLTANEVYPIKGTAGSNPARSAVIIA